MQAGMYSMSIPVLGRVMGNLRAILEKGVQYAAQRSIAEEVLLQSRLYPDMFPLIRQVQTVSDVSKGAAARLGGAEVPKFEDTEKSFADLMQRLDKTIAFIATVDKSAVDASTERRITIPTRDGSMESSGSDYLTKFVLPNVYFHSSMAYAILRHNGVELGKLDFLGAR